MHHDIQNFRTIMTNAWYKFSMEMPSILFAVLLFIIGLFVIRQFSKIFEKIIAQYSKDSLVTDFLVNIISFIFTILLLMIVLSIIGWGSLTNKILAGAGITTFIVGFALKDIGENFLAGIIMAFRRPFKVGDLIEITGLRGKVLRMSLRETTIKTADGRDVYIPNAMILKNPLQNYTIDNQLRSDFLVNLNNTLNIEKAIEIIENVLNSEEKILKTPSTMAVVEDFDKDTVSIRVSFWFHTDDVNAPGIKLRSKMMLWIRKQLLENDININTADADTE